MQRDTTRVKKILDYSATEISMGVDSGGYQGKNEECIIILDSKDRIVILKNKA
jgi:hypothetical protein